MAAAVAAGVLALVGTKPAEAAFPGTNGKIAFSSDRTTGTGVNNPTGDKEIFAMNPDRTGLEQLTDNTANEFDPAWSANGGAIAYRSDRDSVSGEIYTQRYSSLPFNPTTRLTNNTASDSQPTFNHDGSKIAFTSTRDGNPNIYVMNADGTEPKRLTKKVAADLNPVFSPDGKKIAFEGHRESDPEIYVMKAKPESRKKNRPKNLTRNDVSDSQPDWRPIPQP